MAIGLLLGWIIFGRSNENQTDEHNHTAMADSETIWTCSMHPQIRKSESGDCPICGMDLIPLESTPYGSEHVTNCHAVGTDSNYGG